MRTKIITISLLLFASTLYAQTVVQEVKLKNGKIIIGMVNGKRKPLLHEVLFLFEPLPIGSPSTEIDKRSDQVTLSPFKIDKYEVTFE